MSNFVDQHRWNRQAGSPFPVIFLLSSCHLPVIFLSSSCHLPVIFLLVRRFAKVIYDIIEDVRNVTITDSFPKVKQLAHQTLLVMHLRGNRIDHQIYDKSIQ
jgi:hypothetical protein